MKRLVLLLISIFVLVLTACGSDSVDQETASKQDPSSGKDEVSSEPEGIKTNDEGIVVDNVFVFNHINGEAEVIDRLAYVLFEYETLDFVKYQVGYLG